jgi:hypothetical protein
MFVFSNLKVGRVCAAFTGGRAVLTEHAQVFVTDR